MVDKNGANILLFALDKLKWKTKELCRSEDKKEKKDLESIVKYLFNELKKYIDLYQLDPDGDGLIHVSVCTDLYKITEELLGDEEMKVYPNKGGETPLHLAANAGNLKAVELLFKHRPTESQQHLSLELKDSGLTPMMLACGSDSGDVELVRSLKDKGARLDEVTCQGNTCVVQAVSRDNVEIYQEIIPHLPEEFIMKSPSPMLENIIDYMFFVGAKDVLVSELLKSKEDGIKKFKITDKQLKIASKFAAVEFIEFLYDLGIDIRLVNHNLRKECEQVCRNLEGNIDEQDPYSREFMDTYTLEVLGDL